jgi:hypothetical protein
MYRTSGPEKGTLIFLNKASFLCEPKKAAIHFVEPNTQKIIYI